MQAEAPDSTLVIRTAAANFLQKSFIVPAQQLHEELKLQRELKQQTLSLDVDRTEPIETSVGRWLGDKEQAQMKENRKKKEKREKEKAQRKAERTSKQAVVHVAQLATGEQALGKLRADTNAKLSNNELVGAITKLGGTAKGKKDVLHTLLQKLIRDAGGLNALALPSPPAVAATPTAAPMAVVAAPTAVAAAQTAAPAVALTAAQARPRRHA